MMNCIFYAMIGWCGTKWPGWWRGPNPPPPPDPWWRSGLIGIVGGVVGSLATNYALGDSSTAILATAGAFAGGVILKDIASGLMKA